MGRWRLISLALVPALPAMIYGVDENGSMIALAGQTGPSWYHRWPVDRWNFHPGLGIPVVYMLCDDNHDPIYIGSTREFRRRMDHHRLSHSKNYAVDVSQVQWWMAYPFESIEQAFKAEMRLILHYRPWGNRIRVY